MFHALGVGAPEADVPSVTRHPAVTRRVVSSEETRNDGGSRIGGTAGPGALHIPLVFLQQGAEVAIARPQYVVSGEPQVDIMFIETLEDAGELLLGD